MGKAQPVPRCISVSFADSTGAAGVHGDIKTFSSLDCYGTGVLTAIGSAGSSRISFKALDTTDVLSQFRSAVRYFGVTAVKIGYLANAETAEAIASELADLPKDIPLIVDPSLMNRDGEWIVDRSTAEIIRDQLIEKATVITPNIAEAKLLTGLPLETATDIEAAAKHMLQLGATAALITGGHRNGAYSDDLLAWERQDGSSSQVTWLRAARITIDRIHGAGCTLTSGITACVARGQALPVAAEEAKIYLTAALRAGSRWSTDQGTGPLHHFYAWWNQQE